MTTRIAAVKTNIDGIIHDGGALLNQARRTLGNIVAQAEATVHQQLDQVNNIVQQAEDEADQKILDISQCTNGLTAALNLLNLHELEACNNHDSLNLLGIKLGQLGQLKSHLSSSINVCVAKYPLSPLGVRQCIQADIDNATTQSLQVQGDINVGTAESVNAAQTCANAASDNLLRTIDALAHDFKSCVSAIL